MAKTKSVKKVAEEKKVETISTVSLMLDANGKQYQTNGETIVECLEALNPGLVKTKATMTFLIGQKKSSVNFNPMQIRKIIANKLFKEILEKRILRSLH